MQNAIALNGDSAADAARVSLRAAASGASELLTVDSMADDPTDNTARSGERRIDRAVLDADETLPPPPLVVRERPRIVTGQYSIIAPRCAETPLAASPIAACRRGT